MNEEHKKTTNEALSSIDDAWDIIGQANSMILGAKETLIELGWREVRYQNGFRMATYLVHKDLVKSLKEINIHIDECFSLFRNEQHNQAQRIVNSNTHHWVQLPNNMFS